MSRIKVTFCAHDESNDLGGPNIWLRRLLPALRARGIESRVLFLTFDEKEAPTVSALRQEGFDCPAVLWPLYTEQRIRWILERLAEDPPDVFVPNLSPPAHFASRWVRETGIPTIGVMHADNDFYEGLVTEFVFGQSAYRLSALVCVSKMLEEEVGGRTPDLLVRHIPCGVPLPNRLAHAPTGPLRLMYVGRLAEKQKRISDVTRALCRAVSEVPDTEATIIGDGNGRPAVEQILRESGLESAIHLAGKLENREVEKQMGEGHVLVLLSDFEGLPVAVMEAMACGVVPVCLRIRSGIPELVQDGVTGLLVNDRGDDFVRAIHRLRTEPGLWQRLSTAARRRIEVGYSSEVCADRWADIIRTLNRNAGRRSSLRIPRRFSLPPLNPAIAGEDHRMPASPFHREIGRQFRILSGAMMRRFLS